MTKLKLETWMPFYERSLFTRHLDTSKWVALDFPKRFSRDGYVSLLIR